MATVSRRMLDLSPLALHARIAVRNLGRQRGRTIAAGLAVVVAFAALVFADAWARGIGRAIREYAASSRLGVVQIHAPGYLDNVDAFALERRHTLAVDGTRLDHFARIAGVHGVAPRIRFAATGGNGVEETMVLGLGVDPVAELQACPRFLADEVSQGRALAAPDAAADVAVVGAGLAKSLALAPGSALTLEARDARGRINAIDVQVIGVASSSLPDEARWLVIIPLAAAQRLVGLEGRATSIVLGGDVDNADAIATAARAHATTWADRQDLDVRTWREIGAYFEQATKTFAFAQGFLMAVLSVLVVIVVLNVALVTASERTREIGTLTALGAGVGRVRGLLVMEAGVFGAAAGFVGAAIGAAIAALAAAHGIPFEPPNQPMVLVHPDVDLGRAAASVVVAATLSIIGTLPPAIAASRVHPAEALRS